MYIHTPSEHVIRYMVNTSIPIHRCPSMCVHCILPDVIADSVRRRLPARKVGSSKPSRVTCCHLVWSSALIE